MSIEQAREGSSVRSALHAAFERALVDFGATSAGEPIFGWRDRSVGAVVLVAGTHRWLRVVWSHERWARGQWWTGNQDAEAVQGLVKPHVLCVREHVVAPLVYRAELATLLPGQPVSETAVLRSVPELEAGWWHALERSMASIGSVSTERTAVDPSSVSQRISVFFGISVIVDTRRWRPCHGDLTWANVHAHPFAVADWEAWGRAPSGYDAAFLLGHSLLVPAVTHEIETRFGQELDSDDGVVAQLYVMTKLLTRADGGENRDLVGAVHRRVDRLIGQRTRTGLTRQGEHS